MTLNGLGEGFSGVLMPVNLPNRLIFARGARIGSDPVTAPLPKSIIKAKVLGLESTIGAGCCSYPFHVARVISKVICNPMNSKKVGVAIIFALLATQLVLTVKSYLKDQTAGAEFSKQIEASKEESHIERSKRLAVEKEASDAKANIVLLSEKNTNLTREASSLKSHLETKAQLQEKLEQEGMRLRTQFKVLELASSKREDELASAKKELLKASKEAQETASRNKAREDNLVSQIESLKKELNARKQQPEAAIRPLNSAQSSK
jgi:hypothetical protein